MTIYVGPENFEDLTPSASQRIGGGFGQGLSEGLQMLVQQKLKGIQQQKQNEALAQLGLPPNLSPEIQRELLKGMVQEKQSQQKQLITEAEEQKKLDLEQKEKDVLKNTIKHLREKTPEVGLGKTLSRISPKGRKARQYYDTLALNLEKKAATMVGKGTLSKARFEYLIKNLPSSNKTQAANEGALDAWEEILDLNEKNIEQQVSNKEIEQETKVLTNDLATKFLKMAKGNKEKARELARKNGYSF